jgi:hypothetical protein
VIKSAAIVAGFFVFAAVAAGLVIHAFGREPPVAKSVVVAGVFVFVLVAVAGMLLVGATDLEEVAISVALLAVVYVLLIGGGLLMLGGDRNPSLTTRWALFLEVAKFAALILLGFTVLVTANALLEYLAGLMGFHPHR